MKFHYLTFIKYKEYSLQSLLCFLTMMLPFTVVCELTVVSGLSPISQPFHIVCRHQYCSCVDKLLFSLTAIFPCILLHQSASSTSFKIPNPSTHLVLSLLGFFPRDYLDSSPAPVTPAVIDILSFYSLFSLSPQPPVLRH